MTLVGRPRRAEGIKPPNSTAMRIQPKIIPLIQEVYRQIIGHSNPGMPIGDKLETILNHHRALQKKVEASEAEIRRQNELLDIATNNWNLIKPMVVRNEQR